MIKIMKVKLPFSLRMEDAYFSYLVNIYDYSVPDALKIIDYIKAHPSDFSVVRLHRKVSKICITIWKVSYRDNMILTDKLLEFIENDCLPF